MFLLLLPVPPWQGSPSEAQRRGSGLRELAGTFDGANPRAGLSDRALVPDGLPAAPGSDRGPDGGGSVVAAAHRENPLAQEVGAELWSSPQLARLTESISFKLRINHSL